jgi:anaerobic selenocysteine-containing dehydrogenase
LILDDSPGGSAVAWEELERKLVRERALVVSLSSFLVGHAAHADYVVPAPSWLEGYEETGAPPGSTVPLFGISTPLIPAPPGVRDRAETLRRVAALAGVSLPAGSSELLLRERARAIFEVGRGEIFHSRDGTRTAVSSAGSPEGLWKILEEGGCWVGEEAVERPPRSFRMTEDRHAALDRISSLGADPASPPGAGPEAFPLVVIPFRACNPAGEEAVPLLASKLDRESGLNPAPGCALVHPETGRKAQLRDGSAAWMETPSLRLRVVARFDTSVKPGIVHLAVGPAPPHGGNSGGEVTTASLAEFDPGSEERRFRARMREA